MHLRIADWASIVSLSAFSKIIVLKISPSFRSTFVLEKNFKSSRTNRIPFPCAQFTCMTYV